MLPFDLKTSIVKFSHENEPKLGETLEIENTNKLSLILSKCMFMKTNDPLKLLNKKWGIRL